VLSKDQEEICRRLAGQADERFVDTTWFDVVDGGVFIKGAVLWLNCSIHAEVPAGDHDVILLRIHGLRVSSEIDPLVFYTSRFWGLSST
jgi:flavin reductase (DIM6/NTAB) family NADH-FMN oxidoreductase RutF